MNLPFGVPASAGTGRLKAGLRTDGTTQLGSWSQCTASKSWGLSMNLPFGVPASAGPGRLKAGFRTDGTTQPGSWSQCTASKSWGLSMNLPFGVPDLAGPGRLKAGLHTDGTTQPGSWSQCTASKSWGLSMNRRVVARASRPCEHADRDTGETPVPLAFAPDRRSALLFRGSWSQCMREGERRLSMKLPFGVPASAGPGRLKAGLQTRDIAWTGSWSQCMRRNERGLPMNRLVAQAF